MVVPGCSQFRQASGQRGSQALTGHSGCRFGAEDLAGQRRRREFHEQLLLAQGGRVADAGRTGEQRRERHARMPQEEQERRCQEDAEPPV